jgi:hypothetical protein
MFLNDSYSKPVGVCIFGGGVGLRFDPSIQRGDLSRNTAKYVAKRAGNFNPPVNPYVLLLFVTVLCIYT